MINDLHLHANINGAMLDAYLSQGWYRMGQTIFTTTSIDIYDQECNVYWLRYPLANMQFKKSHLQIAKLNKHFKATLKPLIITNEYNNLYSIYRAQMNFETSPTLLEYLGSEGFGVSPQLTVFESYSIEVRDNGVLIAVGIFDNGLQSIAGIINFYNPNYKKYSLGKYVILLKVQHALSIKKAFYYPGYIAEGYNKFDYKLFINKDIAEVWDDKAFEWKLFKEANIYI